MIKVITFSERLQRLEKKVNLLYTQGKSGHVKIEEVKDELEHLSLCTKQQAACNADEELRLQTGPFKVLCDSE